MQTDVHVPCVSTKYLWEKKKRDVFGTSNIVCFSFKLKGLLVNIISLTICRGVYCYKEINIKHYQLCLKVYHSEVRSHNCNVDVAFNLLLSEKKQETKISFHRNEKHALLSNLHSSEKGHYYQLLPVLFSNLQSLPLTLQSFLNSAHFA